MRETVRAGSGWTASLGPGKTTWARELTGAFRANGRPALHLSTDDFHHPRAHPLLRRICGKGLRGPVEELG